MGHNLLNWGDYSNILLPPALLYNLLDIASIALMFISLFIWSSLLSLLWQCILHLFVSLPSVSLYIKLNKIYRKKRRGHSIPY